MRLSEEQFSQLTKDRGKALSGQARPRPRHAPGKMNKTEAAYSQYLEARKHLREIVDWRFEPVKFKLADKTYYTPDFMVIYQDRISYHEIKGFARDDWRVKWKVCVEQFPWFEWVIVKSIKGQWDIKIEN